MKVGQYQFAELLAIAERTVRMDVQPSAADNVAEEVAAQAVWEVVRKIEAGEHVDNPAGLVTVVARRRALDAHRRWARHRHARLVPPGQADGDMFFNEMSGQLAASLSGGGATDQMADWAADLIDEVAQDDRDRLIGRLAFIEGRRPEEVAEIVGRAEATVRNRMTEIKKSVIALIETGDYE